MPIVLTLSVLAAAAAAVHLRAEYAGFRGLVYASKPLTLLILIVLAATLRPEIDPFYRRMVLVGLGLSLVGDILLMWPRDRFVPGLGAFLLAHIAYIVAFGSRVGAFSVMPMLPYVVGGAFMLRLLWPHLGRMRVPVLAYVAAIVLMAGLALAVASDTGGRSAWLAAAGAFLFVFSDATLAMNRFVGEFPSARYIVMATYYPAQWFIALSVLA